MKRRTYLRIIVGGLTFPFQLDAFSPNGIPFSLVLHEKSSIRRTENVLRAEHLTTAADNDAVSRRKILTTAAVTAAAAAAVVVVPGLSSSPAAAVTEVASTLVIDPPQARVTKKVFFNVRISRQDGSFYVRDDLPDTPENRVLTAQLVMGLFGNDAPETVARFLSYLPINQSPVDDNPLPSYDRSIFTRLDEATGLLYGGTIPALEVTEIGGSTALRYRERILPAPLWIERGSNTKIRHTAKGLLTHKILDVTPVFGITTRKDTTELDGAYTVFGQIQETESSREFLSKIQDLPTYSIERPAYMSMGGNDVVESSAQAVFNAQRDFFRNTAKSLGDTRLDNVYQGKLLRRVEVTQVGIL